jgi:hypothetical protein
MRLPVATATGALWTKRPRGDHATCVPEQTEHGGCQRSFMGQADVGNVRESRSLVSARQPDKKLVKKLKRGQAPHFCVWEPVAPSVRFLIFSIRRMTEI